MSNAVARPPVITILGHVDHGKTSLLDSIRHSRVTAGEAGGITQAIGAYQVDYQGRLLTFIDTPGHAAFSSMRQRGGAVADIAILVVAADDGVMPQTKESIAHIKSAGIPYIVAINKLDIPDANPTRVKTQLSEVGEYVEGFGGNIPVVEISAKTGQNLDLLLETLILLADLQGLSDTSDQSAAAIVIESELHPNKGPLATLLVKSGQFKERETLYDSSKSEAGKIRAMFNFKGEKITLATPSTPFQVIGLTRVPPVGEIISTDPQAQLSSTVKTGSVTATTQAESGLNIVLKTDVFGSLEAISASLPEGINIVSSGVGMVSESDIESAVAQKALVICFNARASSSVRKLAEFEGVQVVTFNIIYELFDYLKDIREQKLSQAQVKTEVGQAKVLKIFDIGGHIIYGCQVISGKLRIGDQVGESQIATLQVGRDAAIEVKKGQECGLSFEPPLDLKPGDVIQSHSQEK